MKKLLKIALLVSSLSLFAENAPIIPIPDKNTPHKGIFREKIEKIATFCNQAEDSLDIALPLLITVALPIGANFALDFLGVLFHECGHAIPSVITGEGCQIVINAPDDFLLPFSGSCTLSKKFPFLCTVLGPVAGVSTTYLQCTAIKALRDHWIQDKPLSECFKHALKFPITFFAAAVKRGEECCSSWLNAQPLPAESEFEIDDKKLISLGTNTLIFMRMIRMIQEPIYGFLPYKLEGDTPGDGERIWHTLLGQQPPTFKVDLTAAAVCVMAAPVALGAMKAIYKKTIEKCNGTKKATSESPISADIQEQKAA
jgi:hypothetical protein